MMALMISLGAVGVAIIAFGLWMRHLHKKEEREWDEFLAPEAEASQHSRKNITLDDYT